MAELAVVKRSQTIHVLGALVAGVLLLCASMLKESLRLIYNPSASAPLGWYFIRQANTLRPHDVVLAWPPEAAAALADSRHYLPRGVPLLKEVGAVARQFVCVRDGTVSIDGVPSAQTRQRDGAGRELISWNECRVLADGELFLLGHHSDASFDSRYFGPIRGDAVIGQAIPLWTW
jgi:conjugative transfer signal peptidase TraF